MLSKRVQRYTNPLEAKHGGALAQSGSSLQKKNTQQVVARITGRSGYFSKVLSRLGRPKRKFTLFGNRIDSIIQTISQSMSSPFKLVSGSRKDFLTAKKLELSIKKVRKIPRVVSLIGVSPGESIFYAGKDKRKARSKIKLPKKSPPPFKSTRVRQKLNAPSKEELAHLTSLVHLHNSDQQSSKPLSKEEAKTKKLFVKDLLVVLRTFYDPEATLEDNPFYSNTNLFRREAIQWHPRIRNMLLQLWELMPKETDGNIGKSGYISMSLKVYRSLVDDTIDASLENLRLQHCSEDWEADRMGYDRLNKDRFCRLWFQLADHWTHTISVRKYIQFLENVYNAISDRILGTYELRSDENIRNFNERLTAKINTTAKKLNKIFSDDWGFCSKKHLLFMMENMNIMDDDTCLIDPTFSKNRNGLFTASTMPPSGGWANMAQDAYSVGYTRLHIHAQNTAMKDSLARSHSLAIKRILSANLKPSKQLPRLTYEQKNLQKALLQELKHVSNSFQSQSRQVNEQEAVVESKVLFRATVVENNIRREIMSPGIHFNPRVKRPRSALLRRGLHFQGVPLPIQKPHKKRGVYAAKKRPRSAGGRSVPFKQESVKLGGLVAFKKISNIFGSSSQVAEVKREVHKSSSKQRQDFYAKRTIQGKNEGKRTLQIEGIDESTSNDAVHGMFERWGTPVEKVTRISKYGISVTFISHNDFRKAIQMFAIMANCEKEVILQPVSSFRQSNYKEKMNASFLHPYDEDGVVVNKRNASPPLSPLRVPRVFRK